MKRLLFTCLCATGLLVLSALCAAALEGKPPHLPDAGEERLPAADADNGKDRPMLIIRGKGGKILDVRGQGLSPDNSSRQDKAKPYPDR
ncbi:hypothetical protein [Pseudodesulfovibrio senegalensis]|jgi:hypothetical protein|uniref:Uncharacterized protein n=1 Tax=Pseudodesulfovibrio senegalensis TaxID=1721087 RepID=A0A6N6N404_9BACT|nr:hypothetical protein [Pseudodesulfovibrio senegalensis]KAB1442912.1 hypothetical protein F8A88_01150 [Pseudodesulfovibrio senegalensis]